MAISLQRKFGKSVGTRSSQSCEWLSTYLPMMHSKSKTQFSTRRQLRLQRTTNQLLLTFAFAKQYLQTLVGGLPLPGVFVLLRASNNDPDDPRARRRYESRIQDSCCRATNRRHRALRTFLRRIPSPLAIARLDALPCIATGRPLYSVWSTSAIAARRRRKDKAAKIQSGANS